MQLIIAFYKIIVLRLNVRQKQKFVSPFGIISTSPTHVFPPRYLKIMRRISAIDGDVTARKTLLEEDLKRTDKIMMLEKVHPDKIRVLKLKMNIIGSFFYNGLSAADVPVFNNEEIEVKHKKGPNDEQEEDDDDEFDDDEDDDEASGSNGKEEL